MVSSASLMDDIFASSSPEAPSALEWMVSVRRRKHSVCSLYPLNPSPARGSRQAAQRGSCKKPQAIESASPQSTQNNSAPRPQRANTTDNRRRPNIKRAATDSRGQPPKYPLRSSDQAVRRAFPGLPDPPRRQPTDGASARFHNERPEERSVLTLQHIPHRGDTDVLTALLAGHQRGFHRASSTALRRAASSSVGLQPPWTGVTPGVGPTCSGGRRRLSTFHMGGSSLGKDLEAAELSNWKRKNLKLLEELFQQQPSAVADSLHRTYSFALPPLPASVTAHLNKQTGDLDAAPPQSPFPPLLWRGVSTDSPSACSVPSADAAREMCLCEVALTSSTTAGSASSRQSSSPIVSPEAFPQPSLASLVKFTGRATRLESKHRLYKSTSAILGHGFSGKACPYLAPQAPHL